MSERGDDICSLRLRGEDIISEKSSLLNTTTKAHPEIARASSPLDLAGFKLLEIAAKPRHHEDNITYRGLGYAACVCRRWRVAPHMHPHDPVLGQCRDGRDRRGET